MKILDNLVVGTETITTMHGPMVQPKYAPSPLGELLDDLRKALRLTIHQTAEALEIDPVDVYSIRNGRKTFSTNEFLVGVEQLVRKAEGVYPAKTLITFPWVEEKP